MKMSEIREKSEKELRTALFESRESLRGVRFGIAERETKNISEHRKIRREIARILTVLHERS